MQASKEELERTQRQTEQNLKLFEELNNQQAIYEQRRDALVKQLGASSLDEISQAQKKASTPMNANIWPRKKRPSRMNCARTLTPRPRKPVSKASRSRGPTPADATDEPDDLMIEQ